MSEAPRASDSFFLSPRGGLVTSYRDFFYFLAPFYDEISSKKDATPEALKSLRPTLGEGSQILELGVGTGRAASILTDWGWTVYGLDVSGPMLERAAAKAFRRGRMVLVNANALAIPLPDRSVDAAISIGGPLIGVSDGRRLRILSYLLSPDEAGLVSEVHRCLRPGGVFAICVQHEPRDGLEIGLSDGYTYQLIKTRSSRTTVVREHRVMERGRALFLERYRLNEFALPRFERLAYGEGFVREDRLAARPWWLTFRKNGEAIDCSGG